MSITIEADMVLKKGGKINTKSKKFNEKNTKSVFVLQNFMFTFNVLLAIFFILYVNFTNNF